MVWSPRTAATVGTVRSLLLCAVLSLISCSMGCCEPLEQLERFGEAQTFGSHEKRERVAVDLAPEAVETLRVRIDHEGWRTILMEGAPGEIPLSTPAQADIPSDNRFDGDPGLELCDFVLGAMCGKPGGRDGRASGKGRRLRRIEQMQKVFASLPEPHEEVGDVPALADHFGEFDQSRVRNRSEEHTSELQSRL